MKLLKNKVYVVGNSNSYASWLDSRKLVETMEEADLVLFTGGEDIEPTRYKEPCGTYTSFNEHRDHLEVREFTKAVSLNKPILGICRGAQLGCVMSGGLLIQHMQHPFNHKITMYEGSELAINSLHHQMMLPYSLPVADYNVLGYAEGLSPVHLNGYNVQRGLPTTKKGAKFEPEIVYFKKTRCLGIQCHPEMMARSCKAIEIFNDLVILLVDGNLTRAYDDKIPVQYLSSLITKLGTDSSLEVPIEFLSTSQNELFEQVTDQPVITEVKTGGYFMVPDLAIVN